MKRILIICLFTTIAVGCYSQNIKAKYIDLHADTCPSKLPVSKISRNVSLIDENKTYDFTIDFVSRIKHSYYIGAHTMFEDSIVCVKILSPKTKGYHGYRKIKAGNTYPMGVELLFPYYLMHSLDYYNNYIFLFRKEFVPLQATVCMQYIHISDNLKGLRLVSCIDTNTMSLFMQRVNIDSFANDVILSVLKKDSNHLSTCVDTSSVILCLKKFPFEFSVVNFKRIRCLPPYKIKKSYYIRSEIRNMSTNNKLLFSLLDEYLAKYVVDDVSSVEFIESKMVYSEYPYFTYMVTWSSPQLPCNMVTYLSIKCNECKLWVVGISSHSAPKISRQ